MPADFDHIAINYDADFTNSVIGKAQRQLVFESLNTCVSNLDQLNILEINCGTGEDALVLAQKGASITATDVSEQMVKEARKKTKSFPNASCEVLDINQLNTFKANKKFDLIFSNFGGLNCLSVSQLETFFANATTKLTAKGKLILVIMPGFCLWETAYFLLKLKFKEAFRRQNTNGISANVDRKNVHTYYYSPKKIAQLSTGFSVLKTAPIGFFVPPSYLNPFFKKRPKMLHKLLKMDQKQQRNSFFSSFSDHYLICLQTQ